MRVLNVEPSKVTSKSAVMSIGDGVINNWAARVIAGSIEVDVMRVASIEPSELTSELVITIMGGGVITNKVAKLLFLNVLSEIFQVENG